ncbi:MAG: tyrosine-type recombinase/integrase [Elusimicrobia bacterium]|nr:tyrosine-type recombinase/integrase [Elusimicrobiota bacterium]
MARGIWIRTRPKGKEVWIVLRDSEGRRRREKIGTDTPENRRLAKDVLRKREAEIVAGKYFPERKAQSMAFRQIAEKWLELIAPQRSKTWRPMIMKLIEEFGGKRCSEITTAELQAFYNRKMEASSASTANRHLCLMRSIFNRAIEWGDFYGDNPARMVKRKPENPHRMRFLSQDEMVRFLEACDPRLYPLAICALTTGMRGGEMFALRWENVDMEHGIIYIVKSKSGKSRQIPISSKLRNVLEGLRGRGEGRVFMLPYMTFRRLLDKARNDCGLPPFRWHDLRHTFASHFIMKTGNLPALQNLMGHATTAMTLRYAHLAKGHLQSEMALFDSAIPALRDLESYGIGHQGSHQHLLPL